MKKLLTLIILAALLLQMVPVGWPWQIERPDRDIDQTASAFRNVFELLKK